MSEDFKRGTCYIPRGRKVPCIHLSEQDVANDVRFRDAKVRRSVLELIKYPVAGRWSTAARPRSDVEREDEYESIEDVRYCVWWTWKWQT